MKILIHSLTAFLLVLHALSAQQTFLLSQYTENQSLLNPAAISLDYLEYHQQRSAGLSFRSQWTRMEEAPQTAFGRFDYVREGTNLTSFGTTLLQDRVGATSQTGVFARYAYHIRQPMGWGSELLIGVGLSFGLVQYRIDSQALEFEAGDPLNGGGARRITPDFSIGANLAYYPETGIKYYAGLALPQVAGLDVRFAAGEEEGFMIQRLRHLYAIGGAIIPIGQQGFLEPSVWIKKTRNIPMHVNFNIRQKFVNDFWFGLGYSTASTLHLESGLILADLIGWSDELIRVSYGFDYNLGSYSNFLGSTHEITLSMGW